MPQHSLYYFRIDPESIFEEVPCHQANDMNRSSHRKKFTFSCIRLFQRLHRIVGVQIPHELISIRLHWPFSRCEFSSLLDPASEYFWYLVKSRFKDISMSEIDFRLEILPWFCILGKKQFYSLVSKRDSIDRATFLTTPRSPAVEVCEEVQRVVSQTSFLGRYLGLWGLVHARKCDKNSPNMWSIGTSPSAENGEEIRRSLHLFNSWLSSIDNEQNGNFLECIIARHFRKQNDWIEWVTISFSFSFSFSFLFLIPFSVHT
jgi:hypothetical protein